MIGSMKILALLLILICQPYSPPTTGFAAQDQPNVKEPAEINQFCFLDSTGDIRPLEQQTLKGSVIQGDSSTFRFVQGEPLAFVVKLSSPEADLITTFQFFRLSVKGEDRVMEKVAKGSKKGERPPGTIPFEAVGYGESSFKIKPKADLGPGEYALQVTSEKDGYCFGVDPVKTDLK